MGNRSDWKHFVNIWLEHRKTTEDPFFRFMCSFIAFNHLFTSTDKAAGLPGRYKSRTHAEQLIVPLIFKSLNAFKEKTPCVSFSLDFSELPQMKETIWEGNDLGKPKPFHERCPNGSPCLDYREKYSNYASVEDSQWDIVDLFIKIYKVRNNLFHGWKTPDGPWDTTSHTGWNTRWVAESDLVLHQYLRAMLNLDEIPNYSEIVAQRLGDFDRNRRHP